MELHFDLAPLLPGIAVGSRDDYSLPIARVVEQNQDKTPFVPPRFAAKIAIAFCFPPSKKEVARNRDCEAAASPA